MIRPAAAALCLGALAAGCAAGPAPRRAEPVGPVVVLAEAVGAGERYVGTQACAGCHAAAWSAWRATRHASSMDALSGPDAADPACLRCHATGFGDPFGYRRGLEPDLGAVGCEACHGPGSAHAGSRYPELVPTATGGACPPCEVNRVCRACHTPERSPGFDLGRDLRRVACGGAGPLPPRDGGR